MSNEFDNFAKKVFANKREFADELSRLFEGPQGPAAAELMYHVVKNPSNRFVTEFTSILQIHLKRSHHERVLRSLSGQE